jgi:hypothetical protein
MRAYIGARGPRIGRLRTGVGMSTHATLTGFCVWLLVVGVAELAAVVLASPAAAAPVDDYVSAVRATVPGVSENPRNTDIVILRLGERICDNLRAGATGYEEMQRLEQSGYADAYQAAMLLIPARAYLCPDVPPDTAR